MTNLKRHLTAANVLSCMALFIALGGTAYAAVKLKPNQVKAVNIASQAVTKLTVRLDRKPVADLRGGRPVLNVRLRGRSGRRLTVDALAADGRVLASASAPVRKLRAGKRHVRSGGGIGGSVRPA